MNTALIQNCKTFHCIIIAFFWKKHCPCDLQWMHSVQVLSFCFYKNAIKGRSENSNVELVKSSGKALNWQKVWLFSLSGSHIIKLMQWNLITLKQAQSKQEIFSKHYLTHFWFQRILESEVSDWLTGGLASRHGLRRVASGELLPKCVGQHSHSSARHFSLPKSDITTDVSPLGQRLNSWTDRHGN